MLDLITPTHNATLARAPIKVNTINATMTKIPFEHGNFYIIIITHALLGTHLHSRGLKINVHGDNNGKVVSRWT